MNVEEFLKEENGAKYNFEFENEALRKIKDTYSRYFAYKANTDMAKASIYEQGRNFAEGTEKYGCIADCDGTLATDENDTCMLTRKLYRNLWGWKDSEEDKLSRYGVAMCDQFGSLGPDTMNSAQTIVNDIIKGAFANCVDDEIIKLKKGRYSTNFIIELFANECSNKTFRSWLDRIEGLSDFLKLYHTLGNFVLVPAGFNLGRYSETKDYWDLSLDILKEEGYRDFKHNNFSKYINTFFLWDYIYCDDKKYKIKSLFSDNFQKSGTGEDSHSIRMNDKKDKEGSDVPTCNLEITNFLKNVNWAIKRRGIFMVAMLKIASMPDESKIEIEGLEAWKSWDVSIWYKLIVKEVLYQNTEMAGYGVVFEKIIKCLDEYEKNPKIKDIEKKEISEIRGIISEAKKKINEVKLSKLPKRKK